MHVVTGGAYHGKSAWVKKFYHLNSDVTWLSAYNDDPCPIHMTSPTNIIVLEGVEEWIRQSLKNNTFNRHDGRQLINQWLAWEQEKSERQIVVIGNDISKGIVPIEREYREWRDVTGWFFQDLVLHSHRFDVIWYGIHKQLK